MTSLPELGAPLDDRPNDARPPGRYRVRHLFRWHRLATVYNHVKATTGGYAPLGFNPRAVVPNTPTNRGRFNRTARGTHSSKYFSFAGVGKDIRLAVWEILDKHYVDQFAPRTVTIAPDMYNDYSVAFARPARMLRILRLTSQNDALPFRARFETLSGRNYYYTRLWAQYFRANVAELDGIKYISARAGYDFAGGYALVLFGPLDGKGENVGAPIVKAVGEPVRLSEPAGQKMLRRMFRGMSVSF